MSVVSLTEVKSARRSSVNEMVRIFRCVACGSYSFKIIGFPNGDHVACANCEAWINEFTLTRTREDI